MFSDTNVLQVKRGRSSPITPTNNVLPLPVLSSGFSAITARCNQAPSIEATGACLCLGFIKSRRNKKGINYLIAQKKKKVAATVMVRVPDCVNVHQTTLGIDNLRIAGSLAL